MTSLANGDFSVLNNAATMFGMQPSATTPLTALSVLGDAEGG